MDSRTGAPRRRADLSDGWNPDGDGPAADDARARVPKTRGRAGADEPTPRASAAPPGPSHRLRRGVIAAVVVALVAAGIYGVCSLSPVRKVLRQSFTQINTPTLQFYFNGDPWVSGELLNLPLGLLWHNGSSSGDYHVRVWIVDGGGKTDFSSTVALPVRDGAGTQNFSLLIPAGGQVVWAQVEGTSLSVHYRFAGSAFASPSGTR